MRFAFDITPAVLMLFAYMPMASPANIRPYTPPLRCYNPLYDPGVERMTSNPPNANHQAMVAIMAAIRAEPPVRKDRLRHWTRNRADPHVGVRDWRIAQQFSFQSCRIQLRKFSDPERGRSRGYVSPSWDDWISYSGILDAAERIQRWCGTTRTAQSFGGEAEVGHGKGYGVRLFCGHFGGLTSSSGPGSVANATLDGMDPWL